MKYSLLVSAALIVTASSMVHADTSHSVDLSSVDKQAAVVGRHSDRLVVVKHGKIELAHVVVDVRSATENERMGRS